MEDLLPAPGSDGAYTFAAQDVVSAIGDGSEIIVMDKPGLTMFWSSQTGLAYNWSGYDIEGEGEITEYRGLLSDIKLVSQSSPPTAANPYTIVDTELRAKLADGCVIITMDNPDMFLFWSKRKQRAYLWDAPSLLSSKKS